MFTVRCISCQLVFQLDARPSDGRVQCPGCGAAHRLAALPTSTAGDSMMISPAALKQMIESPQGPDAARAYEPTEPVVLCPSCKVRLYVDRKKYGGKLVKCPSCNQPMVIPRSADEPAQRPPKKTSAVQPTRDETAEEDGD